MPGKKSTKAVVGGVAAVAMLLVSGCSSNAKKVPPDLCAVMTAPPLTGFMAGGTPEHRAKNDSSLSRADCEVVSASGRLAVELARYGDRPKHNADYYAKLHFESGKSAAIYAYRCSNPPRSPRLGKNSYECPSDKRLAITVRKGNDLLELTVSGSRATQPDALEVLRGYADQVVKIL